MKQLALAALAATLTLSASPDAMAQTPAPTPAASAEDPFLWLEEVQGEKALDWARSENARSLPVLKGDPRYQGLFDDALKIVTAQDRIPMVGFAGPKDSELRNFWQDAEHVRGVWRQTGISSYATDAPEWETLLDLDAISKAEGKNWVWKGAQCLPPSDRYCLVSLSDGGKDAVTVREYDTQEKRFVEGGFVSPESKQNITWLDEDTVLIARDWGEGSMTKSSYPFVLGVWKRGQPVDQVKEVFRGSEDDITVAPFVLRGDSRQVVAPMIYRAVSFFETEYYLFTGGKPVKMPWPLKLSVEDYVRGKVVVSLKQDWPEQNLKQGDLAAFNLADLQADPAKARAELILRPGPRESIEGVTATQGSLVVALYQDVKGSAWFFTPEASGWTRTKIDLPENSSVGIGSSAHSIDRVMITVTGYLEPTTLWMADIRPGVAPRKLKAAPAKFDASNDVVEQFEATSKDGTKIPYFVVRPKDLKYDGQAPTLLYGYGGFEVSMTPGYSGTVGKLWLERGGVYVVANIRGGGEFGPGWHEQGLKENRQRVYDDFFAVSEDLIARKITSPKRLGIMGGSNGGLLMGVALTQRPELYNAVVIQVPLFDMKRYTVMGGAGASWAGEYGDGTDPKDWAYISKYSPYQAIKPGQLYPQVYIETSTKDDRVAPGHARKAAAKLQSLGYDVLYYENIDGGHAASANLNETAMRVALEFTYLSRRLMD